MICFKKNRIFQIGEPGFYCFKNTNRWHRMRLFRPEIVCNWKFLKKINLHSPFVARHVRYLPEYTMDKIVEFISIRYIGDKIPWNNTWILRSFSFTHKGKTESCFLNGFKSIQQQMLFLQHKRSGWNIYPSGDVIHRSKWKWKQGSICWLRERWGYFELSRADWSRRQILSDLVHCIPVDDIL